MQIEINSFWIGQPVCFVLHLVLQIDYDRARLGRRPVPNAGDLRQLAAYVERKEAAISKTEAKKRNR